MAEEEDTWSHANEDEVAGEALTVISEENDSDATDSSLKSAAWICETCDKRYSRKGRLRIHIQENHPDVSQTYNVTQNRFSCPFCCSLPPFRKMADLLSHCKMDHNADLGLKVVKFDSFIEFEIWKEKEEEATYSAYVRNQKSYTPTSAMTDIKQKHYYICCRDGLFQCNSKPRQTNKLRPNQKVSRKINDTCVSRMYVTEYKDGKVMVEFISAHSGHELGVTELPHLPLPNGTKKEVAMKLNLGIPPERIMEGKKYNY